MHNQSIPSSRTRPCEQCGLPHTPTAAQLRKGGGRFCSYACKGDWMRKTITLACEICGAPVVTLQSRVAVGSGRFCSRSCANSNRTIPAEERFWALVDRRGPDECWPWLGARDHHEYGLFAVSHSKQMTAHRFALQLQTGPLEPHILACHTCDNPPCCNPAHLFAGDNTANMADMVQKGRSLTGEKHPGRKLTEDDVRDIRFLYSEGLTQSAIAVQYGMNQTTIGDIVHHRYWTHVS